MKIHIQYLICLLVFTVYNYICCADDDTTNRIEVPIGAFFHEEDSLTRAVFDSIFTKFNDEKHDFFFKPIVKVIKETDVFEAGKLMCDMGRNGVVGVIGPSSPTTAPIIESICLSMNLPYIQTSWRPSAAANLYSEISTHINFFPQSDLLIKGIGEVAKYLEWKTFVVLYEDSDSLIKLQNVLKLQNFDANVKQNAIIIKHLGTGPDYRGVLKEVYNTTEKHIVLDCAIENMLEIFKQARESNLTGAPYQYFLTNLDSHTVDLSSLDEGDLKKTNITTIRIMQPQEQNFMLTISSWEGDQEIQKKIDSNLDPFFIKTETALMYDAVNVLLTIIKDNGTRRSIKPKSFDCLDNNREWHSGGFPIIPYLKDKDYTEVLVSPLRFSRNGKRNDFTIYLVEGNKNETLGSWRPEEEFKFTKSQSERVTEAIRRLERHQIIVTSRLDEPYLKRKNPNSTVMMGNDEFEGFSMDLITAIFEEMKPKYNFTFTFRLTPDNSYGKYNKDTKMWDGLIQDILTGEAHLAICDLTITHQRREVVDFSTPFMRLGISILHKKAEEKNVSTFAFLDPFRTDLWIYSATLYLILTVVVYFIARMSPPDWENPHPCDENPEELENIWDLKNCLWLTLGSIMNQGCDILPKGISSRMATAMWWFFTIIITNSYMANLTAFLTTGKMESGINSAEDLAKQTKVKYGTLAGGSTEAFFRESNYSIHQRMWAAMEQAKPSVFEKTNLDGVNRVLNTKHGLYAFLIESTTLEYQLQTKCDLRRVGDWLDSKGYGIAMPINFQLRTQINEAILHLQDKGEIKRIKNVWWKENRTEPLCDPKEEEDDEASQKLSLKELRGIFLVLGVGVVLSYIVGFAEFLWNIRNVSVEEHISYWQALKVEVQFALNVWVTRKKVKPKISGSSSSHSKDDDVRSIARSILHGAGSFLHLNVLSRSRSRSRESQLSQ